MSILDAVACVLLGGVFYDELRRALNGLRGVRSVIFLAVACVAFAFACSDGGTGLDLPVCLVALGLWDADVIRDLLRDLT